MALRPGLRVVIDTIAADRELRSRCRRGTMKSASPGKSATTIWTSLGRMPCNWNFARSAMPTWQPLYRQLRPAASITRSRHAPACSMSGFAPATWPAIRRSDHASQPEQAGQAAIRPSLPAAVSNPVPLASAQRPWISNRKFINTKRRISLNYEITKKGPSGISGIDLWFTTDGRSWSKFNCPKIGHHERLSMAR